MKESLIKKAICVFCKFQILTSLDFAELQALNRKPMYMKDWAVKLDDFLKINDREVLTHFRSVSHEAALEKARREYEIYRERMKDLPSQIEKHFLEMRQELKQLEKKARE